MNISFSNTCPFPEVFRETKNVDVSAAAHPVSETAYSRSDYHGGHWWTTWFDCTKTPLSRELASEIDLFQNTLLELDAFKNLSAMRDICRTAESTQDPTEYNLYSGTEHFHIRLRLITRTNDYNLYVHYYLKSFQ